MILKTVNKCLIFQDCTNNIVIVSSDEEEVHDETVTQQNPSEVFADEEVNVIPVVVSSDKEDILLTPSIDVSA